MNAEDLTITNYGIVQEPTEEFVEFVNATLRLTNTKFCDWRFVGQKNTQSIKDGYFSAFYEGYECGWNGQGLDLRFNLSTGGFHLDARQAFVTNAAGFLWWWNNAYDSDRGTKKIQDINPELIIKGVAMPRKNGMSAKAKQSLEQLIALANKGNTCI